MPSLKTFTWGVVISALTDQTLDNFDFQSSFIPILVEDFTPNKTQFVTSKITSNNLMSRLKVLLPTTKVQILMMPNSFYTTIKYSPR